MKAMQRVMAVAAKEWHLNLRFPSEYIANNAISPLKSAVLMYILYRGFLTGDQHLGLVGRGNYTPFVLIGTTCHSLFIAAVSTFRSKMVSEKYWQTILGTLVSPASMFEIILGFIIGSIGIHLFVSALILAIVSAIYGVSLQILLVSLVIMLSVVLIGFGLGLIGTTLNLVWEGHSYLFDYFTQALIFLSCFYYPVETLPKFIQPAVHLLPTYRAANAIQQLFLFGQVSHFPEVMAYLLVSSVLILGLPALFMDYSLKRFGITGY